jgi:hypothetical protein
MEQWRKRFQVEVIAKMSDDALCMMYELLGDIATEKHRLDKKQYDQIVLNLMCDVAYEGNVRAAVQQGHPNDQAEEYDRVRDCQA